MLNKSLYKKAVIILNVKYQKKAKFTLVNPEEK